MAVAATQQPQILTVSSLAGMSPAQRAQYVNSFSDPKQRAAASADVMEARAQANADYLARSIPKHVLCPPTTGGLTAAYSNGAVLVFNIPTGNGLFLRELLFTVTYTFTAAAGTGATYATTAGAPYNIFDNIEILLNGASQSKLKPYVLKYWQQLRGFQRPVFGPDGPIIAGNQNTTIENQIYSVPAITTGANTWTFMMRVPLADIHHHSPAGMVPAMGTSTPGQIKVTCNTTALGVDPILNNIYASGGTGNAITGVGGTVKCEAIAYDGTNLWGPTNLYLDLEGEPTAQWVIDNVLQPLQANTVQRFKITTLLQHYFVLCVVVDGNQSNKFSALTNLTSFGMDQDSVGQNKFFLYGTGTNQAVYDYYELTRKRIGQDLDEGVFPFVVAPSYGQENTDNREGTMILNMQPGGWTDANVELIAGTVGGVVGITPRVETYLYSLNPAGLVLA